MRVLDLLTVGAMVLLGCSTTHPLPREPSEIWVTMAPQDFRSSFGNGQSDTHGPAEWHGALAVSWTGSFGGDRELERRAIDVIGSGVYLADLSSSTRVPGEVREGVVRLDGEVVPGWPNGDVMGVVSFVPSEPLEDGWYVLVADLREWIAMGTQVATGEDAAASPVEDHVMFVRVRMGAGPVWYQSGVNCGTRPRGARDTWCDVWAATSEPVESLGTTRFELRVGGELASDCVQPSGPAAWECPYYPDGTDFEIRLVESDVVGALDGITAQTFVGGGAAYPKPLVAPRFGIDAARGAR